MNIRPIFGKQDMKDIDRVYKEFYQSQFTLPSLKHTITSAVAYNKEFVGFGLVKLWAEAIMILDRNKPILSQTKAMDALMKQAIDACNHYEIQNLHCNVQSLKLSNLLKKHYKFEDINGILLVRRGE